MNQTTKEMREPEEYPCEIREVFSGDDLIAFIDLGTQDLWLRRRIRLAGVDTPNAVGAAESTLAGKIRREVRDLVRNRRGRLRVISKVNNSWVCKVWVESNTPAGVTDLNQYLIDKGYVFSKRTESQ